MKEFKKCQVVMLATKNKTEYLYILSDEEIKEGNYIYSNRTQSIFKAGKFKSKAGFEVHSVTPLKSDVEEGKTYTYCGEDYIQYCKKVIATTNRELDFDIKQDKELVGWAVLKPLPKLSNEFIQYFIEEYNKGNVITEISVKYTWSQRKIMVGHIEKYNHRPKITSDNTIIVNPTKETWKDYFIKLPLQLGNESGKDYRNRIYTWSRDHFNPPTKKK